MLFNVIFALVTVFIIGKIWDLYKKNKEKKNLNDPEYLLDLTVTKMAELRFKLGERLDKAEQELSKLNESDKSDLFELNLWKDNKKYIDNLIAEVRDTEKLFISLQAEYSQEKQKLVGIISDVILFEGLILELIKANSSFDGDNIRIKIDRLKDKFHRLLNNHK